MPNQSITTYLPKDLSERLDAAKAAGLIDPKEVIKSALERALNPEADLGPEPTLLTMGGREAIADLMVLGEFLHQKEILPLWAGDEGTAVEIACRIIEKAVFPMVPVEGGGDVAYELVWAADTQEFQARLDAVTEAGGYPISIAFTSKDGVCLLVGWKT